MPTDSAVITKSLLTLGERGQAGQRGDRHTAGNVAVHSAIVTVTWNKQTLDISISKMSADWKT